MTGHTQLCSLRLKGYVPQLVWVETDPELLIIRLDALIVIAPTDNLRRIDLRVLYGLTCVVGGCDAQRVEDVTAACVCAGAARVIANTRVRIRRCEFKTIKVTDTKGVLTWSS